jgi:citrate synthase
MPDNNEKTTKLCGYDEDNIMVRNKDLVNDLMGKLSFTEMLLLHLLGEMPTPVQTKIIDAVLVTIMEHGLIPSAIASRMTIFGAPESIQGAVAAGLLGVGDRFAGTASECAALLDKIVATEEKNKKDVAQTLVKTLRQNKQPVPGFGHPIHKKVDPRVKRLIDITEEAGAKGEHIKAMYLLETCLEENLGRKLPTNISAAIAAALGEAGIPGKIMRGIVLTARCGGLIGHLLEEMEDPSAGVMWHAIEEAVPFEKE